MMRSATLIVFPCLFAAVLGLVAFGPVAVAADDAETQPLAERVKTRVANELPILGHRNWIVVADSAYPSQAREGIKTVYVGGDQLTVIGAVLEVLDTARHVQPKIYTDAELAHVPEADAPGIGQYRTRLAAMLGDRRPTAKPHIEIIEQLDETAKTFHVLLLKTDLTLPYTTVFMELDCGYWSEEKEARLRAALETK